MTDPRDGLDHLWREVVDGGRWKARCGIDADPATLTDPEDEFGRCTECVLALGRETADAVGVPSSWRM